MTIHYLAELRANWRPLLAATIGLSSGMSLHGTITSAIAPSLIADNGWKMSEFAMVGSIGLASSAAMPFIGRLADVLGVRLTALIGQVIFPLTLLAFSMMPGPISIYIAIFVVQSVFCVTTTAAVYTRLTVQYIQHARGLALAIAASGPALVGAIGGPVLNGFVEDHGWRASYQALAIVIGLAGLVTFLLIPPSATPRKSRADKPRRAREDYGIIFRSPAFWFLVGSMLLCNLPQVIMLTQLKLVMLDNGVDGRGAAVMFTALSLGMLAGRFLTGIALDKFSPYPVAFITLGLPSLGLFIIASDLDAPMVLTLSVFFLGFAFGAEGDVLAYLVARNFGVQIYSSVMGLMTATCSTSAALGATALGMTLEWTGSYTLFLNVVGVAVLLGAFLLLAMVRLEQGQPRQESLSPAAE